MDHIKQLLTDTDVHSNSKGMQSIAVHNYFFVWPREVEHSFHTQVSHHSGQNAVSLPSSMESLVFPFSRFTCLGFLQEYCLFFFSWTLVALKVSWIFFLVSGVLWDRINIPFLTSGHLTKGWSDFTVLCTPPHSGQWSIYSSLCTNCKSKRLRSICN